MTLHLRTEYAKVASRLEASERGASPGKVESGKREQKREEWLQVEREQGGAKRGRAGRDARQPRREGAMSPIPDSTTLRLLRRRVRVFEAASRPPRVPRVRPLAVLLWSTAE